MGILSSLDNTLLFPELGPGPRSLPGQEAGHEIKSVTLDIKSWIPMPAYIS